MKPRVLTALPVYNESSHVGPVLTEVARYADNILVVDDGSTDNTACELAKFPEVHVIRHETNQGYGAGLRSAFDFAVAEGYDVLVTIDCDGQHEPSLIPEIAAAIYPEGDEPYDIVSGSRYLHTFENNKPAPADRRRINHDVTALLNERFDLGASLTDAFCGFKAYRVDSLPCLEVTELGYAMPLQVWVQAARQDFRIIEFPVPLIYLEEERSFGGSLDDARRRMAYYLEVLEREAAQERQPCRSTSDGELEN